MQRSKFRFLLTFGSGMAAALAAVALSGSVPTLAATRYEDLALFSSVLNLVRNNYVEPVDDRKLVRSAVEGMLAGLDPHSSFLDVEEYKEMQIDNRGEFHGLGIEITKRQDGFIEVVSPIDGTPAARAGLRARDLIVAICPTERPEDWTEDCHSTRNMTLFDAVQLMRGKKGSKITIEIMREGFERPKSVAIERDVVKVVSVDGRSLEPGYGYVRVRGFQERTADDLKETLEKLHQESPDGIRGLVLDLRDNPGGLLDQAVKVADSWLSSGLIVYTQGRVDSQRQEFSAHEGDTEGGYPMVVLVNEGSASASEIVAGALQDQHRALVLGMQSFGKGSVQTVYPLEDGSGLRLTTALYYTPAGRSIQEVGISPDIEVAPPAQPTETEASAQPRRLRERDLERHFTHEDAEPEAEPAPEPAEPLSLGSEGAKGDDVQLARAVEVLKSWSYFERLRGAAPPSLRADATPTAQ
jgi:carboxyl-terminal processing protease